MDRGPDLGGGHGSASVALGRAPRSLASVRELLPVAWAYALPFLLVVYLGLKGGGYDAVVRSEVGIAVWWLVLCGSAVAVLPAARVPRVAWVGLGLLFAFALWTALGISWSESSERSMAELGRVLTYSGVFALALFSQGRDGLRRTVDGVAAGIAFVAGLALLSRLQPQLFPSDEVAAAFDSARARLNYPLDYWNGVAAFAAIGVPLLLGVACAARSVLARALACAALPALSLTAFYTLSRGGAVEIAVGLAIFFALYPRRLAALPTALIGAGGSTILIAATTQRDALESGLANAAAQSQGDGMLAMVLVVCAGAALLQAALALADRHGLAPPLRISRRSATVAAGTAAAAAIIIAIGAGAPGELSDRWQEFKQPGGAGSSTERFESTSGNGRYQYWESAVEAGKTEPLTGIGPGTYEFWWAREGTIPGFVRDAHSLYAETFAELGAIGFILIVGLVLYVLGVGARRALGRGSPERRGYVAAATAGCATFAVAAGIDWAWEIAVLPVAFLLLAAAVLSPSAETGEHARSRLAERLPSPARALVVAAAIASIVLVAIPLAGTSSVRDSQSDVRGSRIDSALAEARTAGNVQPYAASPALQEALVLEIAGDLDGAGLAAKAATDAEPTNWRTWLVRSRIEAELGSADASVAAYREAKSLNPRSILFQQ